MAQIIKLKRSLSGGSKPSTSDLAIGELAMNVNDDNVRATFPSSQSGYVVVARGGQIVSGSVDVENIAGLDAKVVTELNEAGVFSGSAQVTLTGDVTGTGAATVISGVDGEEF